MSDAPNPYATPKAVVADAGAASAVEETRRAHLGHEANVKAVGGIFMLGGLFAAFMAFALIVPGLDAPRSELWMLVTGLLVMVLAAGSVAVGWGLRTLRVWARVPGIVLAVIGLLGFPLGTLINIYVLWLLASRKGRMVLSAEYAAIVDATPHIRYRTSKVVWIALIVLVLLVVAVLVGG